MLKGWIDPVTAAKIEIIDSADVVKVLSSYIAPENIPKHFGGSFEFEHGMLPDLDGETRKVLDSVVSVDTSSLVGPFKWVLDELNERSIVPVGTFQGRRRDVIFLGLGAALRSYA